MKIIIDIPNEFTGDYIVNKFKDFFSRVATDIDCKGLCGNYEKEIAEMFIKAFEESEDEDVVKITKGITLWNLDNYVMV